jgi:hypothetical protein
MADQSSLGGKFTSRLPSYNHLQIARVTSVKDFHKYGKIEAIFLDYSQPAPIWVINDVDREPVEGDFILVGFMEGRKDVPYMVGFVKNKSYTTNFMVVKKDKIKLQLPVFDVGVKDGKAHKDVQEHLLDNAKQTQRATVEMTPDHILIHFPFKDGLAPMKVELRKSGEMELRLPVENHSDAYLKGTPSGWEFSHPVGTLTVKKFQDLPSAEVESI